MLIHNSSTNMSGKLSKASLMGYGLKTVVLETDDAVSHILGRLVSLGQATAKNAKMEEVREYMGVRKLPKALQLRMRKHFDHVYRNTSVFRQASGDRDALSVHTTDPTV